MKISIIVLTFVIFSKIIFPNEGGLMNPCPIIGQEFILDITDKKIDNFRLELWVSYKSQSIELEYNYLDHNIISFKIPKNLKEGSFYNLLFKNDHKSEVMSNNLITFKKSKVEDNNHKSANVDAVFKSNQTSFYLYLIGKNELIEFDNLNSLNLFFNRINNQHILILEKKENKYETIQKIYKN